MQAHESQSVTRVQNPSKGFREVVTGVKDSWNVFENNFASLFPILNGKMLNVDVTGSVSGMTCIDQFDGGCIVFVKDSGIVLRESEFLENGAQVKRDLGGRDCSKEFSLSGAGGCTALCLRLVGNGCTGKGEDTSSCGSSCAQVIGVGSIDKTYECERRGG